MSRWAHICTHALLSSLSQLTLEMLIPDLTQFLWKLTKGGSEVIICNLFILTYINVPFLLWLYIYYNYNTLVPFDMSFIMYIIMYVLYRISPKISDSSGKILEIVRSNCTDLEAYYLLRYCIQFIFEDWLLTRFGLAFGCVMA